MASDARLGEAGERIERGPRIAAAVAAAVGWAGLALQLRLIVEVDGLASGLWRFLGFFTILANIGVALVMTAIALGRGGPLAGPRARLMAATSIVIVGLVYSIALRSLWQPTGWQKVADFALHDAMPLLVMLVWVWAPNGALGRRDFAWAMAPPALYAIYALARGAGDGWYAYGFLDPSQQSPVELATGIAILLAGVAIIAALLVWMDRWLGRMEAEARTEEPDAAA